MRFSTKRALSVSEFGLAFLITVFAVVLHFQFCWKAGALWRDEIASLHVANAPTLGDTWRLLRFENHPALHYLILRGWCFLGFGATDFGLRVLCLLVGLLLIAALWICGFVFNKSAPLLPLVFFALNENTLRTESLRPYGLMLVWVVLAFAFTWQLLFQPEAKRRTLILVLTFSVLSVQTDFSSLPALAAIWIGSISVLVVRKSWRGVGLILVIGTISALSVLLYLPMAIRAHSWNQLQVVPRSADFARAAFYWFYWLGAGENRLVCGVFVALMVMFLAVALIPGLRNRIADSSPALREHVLFTFAVCVAAIVGTVSFLWFIGFPPARRYYSPETGVIALSLAVPVVALRAAALPRLLVIVGSVLVTCVFAGPIINESKTKFTNCDSAAATVASNAQAGDIVVLTRFDYGLTFEHYYRGAGPWQTLPPITDYSVFRWDLVKQRMTESDPIREVLERVENALRSGHKVFIIGHLTSFPAEQPLPLAPAPSSQHGWSLYAYLANWRDQLAYLISRHALEGAKVSLASDQRVDPVEELNVSVISGWH